MVTIILYIIVMESQVTAIEMRRKFGGILDRVVQKGEHITIMRGNRPLATLVPAQEHQRQCSSQSRLKDFNEALAELDEWKKRNEGRIKKSRINSTQMIRKMRDSRWAPR